MRTVTATVPAWITSDYFDPKLLIDGDPVIVISGLTFHGTSDMTGVGWVRCGTAEITLTIHDENEVIGNKIAALKATKTAILAKAEAEATRLEGKIQELLCIEYKPNGGAE